MTDIEKGAFNNVKYIIEKAPMNNINKIEFDVGSIIYQNIQTLLNLIKTQQKALEQKDKEIEELKNEKEKYKRLAEQNLKDGKEFQDNMCKHRCLLKNEIQELKADLYECNNIISDYIDTVKEKDKMIDLFKRRIFITENEHKEILKIQEKFLKKDFQDCLIIYFQKKASEVND